MDFVLQGETIEKAGLRQRVRATTVFFPQGEKN